MRADELARRCSVLGTVQIVERRDRSTMRHFQLSAARSSEWSCQRCMSFKYVMDVSRRVSRATTTMSSEGRVRLSRSSKLFGSTS